MAKRRPRPYRTTYDIGGRRPRPRRLAWLVFAAVLGVVLTFAGIAAVSRAVSTSAGPPTTQQQTVPATPSSASAPSPTPSLVAPQDQAEEVTIQNVASSFTDAWLQRDRTKRKAQLEATATAELAAALMKTDDQNLPRTTKEGTATIDARVEGVAIALQCLADTTVLRITLVKTGTAGTWLVSDVDLGEA